MIWFVTPIFGSCFHSSYSFLMAKSFEALPSKKHLTARSSSLLFPLCCALLSVTPSHHILQHRSPGARTSHPARPSPPVHAQSSQACTRKHFSDSVPLFNTHQLCGNTKTRHLKEAFWKLKLGPWTTAIQWLLLRKGKHFCSAFFFCLFVCSVFNSRPVNSGRKYGSHYWGAFYRHYTMVLSQVLISRAMQAKRKI